MTIRNIYNKPIKEFAYQTYCSIYIAVELWPLVNLTLIFSFFERFFMAWVLPGFLDWTGLSTVLLNIWVKAAISSQKEEDLSSFWWVGMLTWVR